MSMKNASMHSKRNRQRGVSLIVTLLISVLLSLLALYGAGILVQDTRSAANDFRAREAMTAAESGVEQGYSLMIANRNFIKTIGLDLNADGDVLDTKESAWTDCTTTVDVCQPIRATDRTNWKYLTINTGTGGLANIPTAGSFQPLFSDAQAR